MPGAMKPQWGALMPFKNTQNVSFKAGSQREACPCKIVVVLDGPACSPPWLRSAGSLCGRMPRTGERHSTTQHSPPAWRCLRGCPGHPPDGGRGAAAGSGVLKHTRGSERELVAVGAAVWRASVSPR